MVTTTRYSELTDTICITHSYTGSIQELYIQLILQPKSISLSLCYIHTLTAIFMDVIDGSSP